MLEFNHEAVLRMLPDRALDTHKGDFGKVLLLCGSKGFTGAAALAAMGALRSGAGLVYLGVPESIYAIEAVKLNEAIVFPLPDENGKLAASSVDEIRTMLPKMNAVLIGPGLGQSSGVLSVVRTVLEEFHGPVVVDADGINILSAHRDLLRGRRSPTILTPHDGEFLRFGGNLDDERVISASKFAQEYGVILLLKGHKTIITDGIVSYVNTTGNPGMASGGSGDVLTGAYAALKGYGYAWLKEKL